VVTNYLDEAHIALRTAEFLAREAERVKNPTRKRQVDATTALVYAQIAAVKMEMWKSE
jgi:hypothetical protein